MTQIREILKFIVESTGGNNMSFVKIENLWIKYGKFSAVKGISFEIPKGEVFGYIGPNGAGKSSTIKALATLVKPYSGSLSIGKIDVVENPSLIRQKIGYLPDFFGVYEDLSVKEYLHFFAAAYQIPMSGRVQSINDVLELTDLDTKIDTRVDDLSRGMKQRLGLARLLLHDPDLLLLDEPASGLDPRARIEMRELLKELRKMGKTIIISSHILSELGELCTRIGIIEQGEMVAEGSLEEIYVKLSIKRLIHAQITNINSEMIRNIERLNGVAGIEKDIDRIAISINEKVLSIENLHREICKLGAEIYMFQPEAMDMESAFMKLTTGKVQ